MINGWTQGFLGLWFVSTLVLITAVDALALLTSEPDKTVSYWLWKVGSDFPALYLLIGFALGHLVLPLVIHNHPPLPK